MHDATHVAATRQSDCLHLGCHCCNTNFSEHAGTNTNLNDSNYVYHDLVWPGWPTPEPSDGYRRLIIHDAVADPSGSSTPQIGEQEDLISGDVSSCTVSVTDEPSISAGTSYTPGCRRINIDVTSNGDNWVVGKIFWQANSFQYDPSTDGSISRIDASLFWKLTDWENPMVRSFVPSFWGESSDAMGAPYPVVGVVIEQSGIRYYSMDTRGADGIPDPTRYYSTAYPTPSNPDDCWREGKCDDQLKTLTSGEFNSYENPDISFDSETSRKITKFGLFFGMISKNSTYEGTVIAPTGNHNLDFSVKLGGVSIFSAPTPKVFYADIGQPMDLGSGVLSHDLTSIPAWSIETSSIQEPPPSTFDESCAGHAAVPVIYQGSLANLTTFGNEWTALRMHTNVDVGTPSDTTGTIFFEFTLQHVETSPPDYFKDHSQWAGIMFGGAFRLLLKRYSYNGFGYGEWKVDAPIQTGGRRYGEGDYGLTIPSVYGGDDYNYPTNSAASYANVQSGDFKNFQGGDRMQVMMRRKYTNAEATAINNQTYANLANGVWPDTQQPPIIRAYPENWWVIYLWLNGRPLGASVAEGAAMHSFYWSQSGGVLPVGILGMCGGRWRDFRVKARP